jgi:hypothetical protein
MEKLGGGTFSRVLTKRGNFGLASRKPGDDAWTSVFKDRTATLSILELPADKGVNQAVMDRKLGTNV